LNDDAGVANDLRPFCHFGRNPRGVLLRRVADRFQPGRASRSRISGCDPRKRIGEAVDDRARRAGAGDDVEPECELKTSLNNCRSEWSSARATENSWDAP
jgi:hypothetical protein